MTVAESKTIYEEAKKYEEGHRIIEGKNLIITYDGDDGSLDAQKIDILIKKKIDFE